MKIHNNPEDIESIFIKINLIKTRWLFCGCYHPPSQSDQCFFENIEKLVDKYSKHYEKFMLSCIELLITNSPLSFQNTKPFSNGLSDFHKMVITVMKMSFKKHSPMERHYRDYKYFILAMNHLKLLSMKC